MIPSEKTRGKVLVLKPEGRLDSNTINAAETEMFSYLEKGETRIVIDLSGLDYISSSGLRLVLMMGKRLSLKGGKLALCGLKPQIREVFEISGFISIITVSGHPRRGRGRGRPLGRLSGLLRRVAVALGGGALVADDQAGDVVRLRAHRRRSDAPRPSATSCTISTDLRCASLSERISRASVNSWPSRSIASEMPSV